MSQTVEKAAQTSNTKGLRRTRTVNNLSIDNSLPQPNDAISYSALTLGLQLKPSPQAALQRIPESELTKKTEEKEMRAGLKEGGIAVIILYNPIYFTNSNLSQKLSQF